MTEKFSKEYEGDWTILIPTDLSKFKSIVTPIFSPLPRTNMTFCFEALYVQCKHKFTSLSVFKLKLVKLSGVNISPTLKVTVNVRISYSDGSLFKEYPAQLSKNVHNMDEVAFEELVQETYVKTGYSTRHDKMKTNSVLLIKCKMTFNDHAEPSHPKNDNEQESSNSYFDFLRNLKSVYEPSTLSDFVFKVGDKTLPAHKVILAAHSPVFRNMMTHEFQESMTNSVTITDVTPEIFDLFLRYLYSGEVEDKSWDSLKELLYLADKYDVGFLKNECIGTAISLLSLDLVCGILQVAYTYSDLRLKAAAKQFAIQHLEEIVLREDWKELVITHPMIGYEVTYDFLSK